ncbi:MAG: ABC transporter ATP-binding protein [Candidatus Hodarchaeales archaeon]|jgi:ABC-type lipoprotein export system ATPase subunit
MLLELTDVIKLYQPENKRLQVPALRGVDLQVEEGELLTLIGPSGSGKSTLIKLIGGIERPSSGTIHMEGVGKVNSLQGRKLDLYRREKIGFIYQFPERNLIPNLTAFENVMLPMRFLGKLGRAERRTRAVELLDAVGLLNRKKNKLHQLSGGEAQRVSIAVALANQPKLVLADEPTGELDSNNTLKVIRYFKSLNEQLGTSFIVVTHDERFSRMTKKAYKISDGRIYGLHRQVVTKEGVIDGTKREHLLLVDKHGNLRLPADIIPEVNINRKVVVKVDKTKGIIEIIPVNE